MVSQVRPLRTDRSSLVISKKQLRLGEGTSITCWLINNSSIFFFFQNSYITSVDFA